jgi:S1-C subfamily serine protease
LWRQDEVSAGRELEPCRIGRTEAAQNAVEANLSHRIAGWRRGTGAILRAQSGSGQRASDRREPIDKRGRQKKISHEKSDGLPEMAGFGGSLCHRDQGVGALAITRQLALARSRPGLLIMRYDRARTGTAIAVTGNKVSRSVQPRPEDYSFDLDRALSAVVSLSAIVPPDAFTAEALGTERSGNGVLVRESGLVLTIGYLVTEASSVWLRFNDGRVVAGHVLGTDQESGIAAVQALERLDVPPLPIGRSGETAIGDRVVVAGGGGRSHAVSARIVARQEFAGYWEYLLEDAIFTGPAHPHWGGTALIGTAGELLGIGSLQLQQDHGTDRAEQLNMVVPIDLVAPVLDQVVKTGRSPRAPRPWLGLYATEIDDRVVVAGLAGGAPAEKAGVEVGDVLAALGQTRIDGLATLFRTLWSLGGPGVPAPFEVIRSGRTLDVTVATTDRELMLKRPVFH